MKVYTVLLILLSILSLTISEKLRFDFNVDYFDGEPDGVSARQILGVNGLFPGPLIQGRIGDEVVVKVTNNIQTREDLAMHWHGLYQRGTPFEDGAEFVNQCAIPYGEYQIYNFTFQQFGTFWYHSHAVHQYTEGLFGPLVILNETETPNELYDEGDEIVLLVSDWNHATGAVVSSWFLSPESEGNEPIPDSTLINGRGSYPCEVAVSNNLTCDPAPQQPPQFWVTKNKTYRFRVINGGGFASFNISIDNHKLQIIEADGVLVDSKNGGDVVDVFTISPGQRYSFLCRMNASEEDNANFLIRSQVRSDMFPEGPNINLNPDALEPETYALLRYEEADLMQKKIKVKAPFQYFSIGQAPFDPVPMTKVQRSKSMVKADELILLNENNLSSLLGPAPEPERRRQDELLQFKLFLNKLVDSEGINRLVFNNITYNVTHGSKPLLAMAVLSETLPSFANPLIVPKLGQVVQIVVNNKDDAGHPLHFHGHDFWVLGKGVEEEGDFDDTKQLNLNGVARDTTFIEGNSWLVIRWRSNNKGVWLFHCHMQWHAMSGLQLAIVEQDDSDLSDIPIPDEAKRICKLNGIDL